MALSNLVIPLDGTPQVFVINLAEVNYTLTVKWNDMMQCWVMDIADEEQNSIVAGIPFVTGADLLSGLEYLEIDGTMFVWTDGDGNAIPTLANLGFDSNLYFQTEAESNG